MRREAKPEQMASPELYRNKVRAVIPQLRKWGMKEAADELERFLSGELKLSEKELRKLIREVNKTNRLSLMMGKYDLGRYKGVIGKSAYQQSQIWSTGLWREVQEELGEEETE